MQGKGLFDQSPEKANKQIKKKESLLTPEEEFIGLSKETLDIMTNKAQFNVQVEIDKTKPKKLQSLLDSSMPKRGLI